MYKEISSCVVCGGKLYFYLDLGLQPLANSYKTTRGEEEQKYPLGLNLCLNCFHSQLSVSVPPSELYENYSYLSGTSLSFKKYLDTFVDKCELDCPDKKLSILEIACNDGSLLEKFQKKGHSVLGVDPAKNLRKITFKKQLEVLVDFWSYKFSRNLRKKFDTIVAMNVFAHGSDPIDFLMGCANALKADGRIYIQTSQANIFKNFEFDTVYHEHFSFFNSNSFKEAAERCGLVISHIEKVPIHGTSYLVCLEKGKEHDASLYEMIKEEQFFGLFDMQKYLDFKNHFLGLRESFHTLVNEL